MFRNTAVAVKVEVLNCHRARKKLAIYGMNTDVRYNIVSLKTPVMTPKATKCCLNLQMKTLAFVHDAVQTQAAQANDNSHSTLGGLKLYRFVWEQNNFVFGGTNSNVF